MGNLASHDRNGPLGWLVFNRAALDGVLRCIDAGHRAAEKALAERPDWEYFAPALAQTKEVEP